jgi:hypothetical protein
MAEFSHHGPTRDGLSYPLASAVRSLEDPPTRQESCDRPDDRRPPIRHDGRSLAELDCCRDVDAARRFGSSSSCFGDTPYFAFHRRAIGGDLTLSSEHVEAKWVPFEPSGRGATVSNRGGRHIGPTARDQLPALLRASPGRAGAHPDNLGDALQARAAGGGACRMPWLSLERHARARTECLSAFRR